MLKLLFCEIFLPKFVHIWCLKPLWCGDVKRNFCACVCVRCFDHWGNKGMSWVSYLIMLISSSWGVFDYVIMVWVEIEVRRSQNLRLRVFKVKNLLSWVYSWKSYVVWCVWGYFGVFEYLLCRIKVGWRYTYA